MRIAVEGCSHGCLDQIYSSILSLDRKAGRKTTLLLLCGDVQTLRNARDMHCLAVPDKYKELGDFHRYYSGQRQAPILTLMIGGNHEASNYLWELYHGGWVAPNIYYLGAAGCVEVGGLKIAGASGIYKSHDYSLGRFEQMPYNHSTVRSMYHTRKYDTYRLDLLSKLPNSKPDIVLSHDWPNAIEQYGDVAWLKKKKPFFTEEINTSSLGSPPLWTLLQSIRPKYWFSAHLHVRFSSLYKHSGESTQVKGGTALQSVLKTTAEEPDSSTKRSVDESIKLKAVNEEEMAIDWSDGEEETQKKEEEGKGSDTELKKFNEDSLDENPIQEHNHTSVGNNANLDTSTHSGSTRFLALSKCLEGQDFLQILEIPAPYDSDSRYQREIVPTEGGEPDAAIFSTTRPSFQFNIPWLGITKATHEYLSLEKRQRELPSDEGFLLHVKDQVEQIRAQTESEASYLDIERTQQFTKTAPSTSDQEGNTAGPPPWYTNPQTVAFCSLLAMENRINPPPLTPAAPKQASGEANNHLMHQGLPRPPIISEEEEIRRIEEAAQAAMKRKKMQDDGKIKEREEPLTLLEDDEGAARWKEGTG